METLFYSQLTVKRSIDYWIERGCTASKMTVGLGAYGRVFKATSGTAARLQPGTSRGVQGPWTKEDGYMAYNEMCNWATKVNPDIKSAVATENHWSANMWGGIETVESAEYKLKSEYIFII